MTSSGSDKTEKGETPFGEKASPRPSHYLPTKLCLSRVRLKTPEYGCVRTGRVICAVRKRYNMAHLLSTVYDLSITSRFVETDLYEGQSLE